MLRSDHQVGQAWLQGTLIAGMEQWLGLLVRPQHDALHDAVVHVVPAARAALAGGAVVFASARAQGLTLELLQPDRALAVPLQESESLPGQAASAAGSQESAVSGAASPSVGAGGGAPKEAATGRAGTAGASTGGRAAWTALQTHKPNLPEWAAEEACLLWLPVQPGGGRLARVCGLGSAAVTDTCVDSSIGVKQAAAASTPAPAATSMSCSQPLSCQEVGWPSPPPPCMLQARSRRRTRRCAQQPLPAGAQCALAGTTLVAWPTLPRAPALSM